MSEDATQLEPAPPEPAGPVMGTQVISYATRPPSNPAAVLALTFGVLLFVPFLGLLAIRYGRRALAAARDHGAGRETLARRAIALGRANVVIWCLAAVAVPPLFVIQRRHARQVQCMSNFRQIGLAATMYAIDNGGVFPDSMDKLPRYLGGGAAALPVYTCPECAGDASKKPATVGTVVTSSYVFCPPSGPMGRIPGMLSVTVLAYEPLTNHNGRGMAVLFCDGHVEWIKGPTAAAVFNELESDQNPPPSLANSP